MLKNHNILITAGPTWVAIDKVRFISNISSGQTGCLIAQEALRKKARVTLLLGPSQIKLRQKNLKVFRYCFFQELLSLLEKNLKSGIFDIVIHAAAVSDYRLKNPIKTKLKSEIKHLSLNLVPTVKIIDKIKRINPGIFLVGFKLETKSAKEGLLKNSAKLFESAKADLVVANTLEKNSYQAIILDNKRKILARASSRLELAEKLIRILGKKL